MQRKGFLKKGGGFEMWLDIKSLVGFFSTNVFGRKGGRGLWMVIKLAPSKLREDAATILQLFHFTILLFWPTFAPTFVAKYDNVINSNRAEG